MPLLGDRVDIATGLMVGGDLIGSGEAQERRIVGKHRILLGAFTAWLSRTAWSLPRAREGCSAICLNADLGLQELKGIKPH
jgi:hypothetical protein